jgi:hypothetical protein
MRRFLSFALTGFAVVVTTWAGNGVPPRAGGSDYPVHRNTQNATLAAGVVSPEMAKKIFPPEVYKNYVVVEVAVFPRDGKTVYVDAFDFGLKFSAGEASYPRTPEEIVSVWEEKSAPQPPSKVDVTTVTGVVYSSGNDPANGRSHGWGTYSGVEVGPGRPAPPRPLSTDPQVFEANVRARALPEGPAVRPVAGYLYFPLPSRKAKSGPVELRYLKDGVLATLPIPAPTR